MKKFLVLSQSTMVNNFETIYSSDLVSIGTMINDLDGWQGYAVMSERNLKKNVTPLVGIPFEEAIEHEFDLIVTSQFAHNAFGGKVGKSFSQFVEYCQRYPYIPIFKYSLDRKIPLNPLFLRFPELTIENPVYPVISYETEDYLERSTKDDVTNIQKITEYDLHIYSPYMLKNHRAIYSSGDIENNSPDLIYGGIFRPDRKKFFDKYLDENNTDYVSEVYGTLSKRPYGNIKTGKIPQSKIVAKNSTALSVILPPEKGYHTITQVRVYESFASNAVTFIHNDYDPDRLLLPDSTFRYFDTYEEYVEKLNILKENETLRLLLLSEQHGYMDNLDIDVSELERIVNDIVGG